MKLDCSIVKDLLPLYSEDLLSPESAQAVSAHLTGCEDCRREAEALRDSPLSPPAAKTAEPEKETVPLRALRRKLYLKGAAIAAAAVLFAAALLIALYAILHIPEYFPYSEDLLTVSESADGGVIVVFRKDVTGYQRASYRTEQTQNGYILSAWTCVWDRLFPRDRGGSLAVVFDPDATPLALSYTGNNGEEDVEILGDPSLQFVHGMTLPQLTLSYYLLIMAAAFVLLCLLRYLLRGTRAKNPLEWLMLYPPAYILAHLCIKGLDGRTYVFFLRDLALILLTSVFIYTGLLLLRWLWRLRINRAKEE